MDAEILTAREIADALKISQSYTYRLLALGIIPTLHLGRAVRVRKSDLEDFVTKSVSGGGSLGNEAGQALEKA